MAARSTWKGAIEFGGFAIYVAAFNMVRSRSGDSFTNLCPCHKQPVKQPKRCSVDDVEVASDTLIKGVEHGGTLMEVPDGAMEALEKTSLLKIEQLCPADSLPKVSNGQFRIVPDPKVPGSEGPVQVLWNGLRKNNQALVVEWTPRQGSRDSILAIVADEDGLVGVQLPYAAELNDGLPEFEPVTDAEQAKMFAAFSSAQGLTPQPFDYSQHESTYIARRTAAVAAALSGEPIQPEDTPADMPAVPDLMAALKASLDAVQDAPKEAPKKKAASKPKETAKS